jgi:hypothetical protein
MDGVATTASLIFFLGTQEVVQLLEEKLLALTNCPKQQ